EPAMVLDGMSDERLHFLLASSIALEIGAAKVGPDDLGAFAPEQLDARPADARARTGDDRDLAGEPLGHRPTPMVEPPSTTITWPVMKVEAGDARYTAAPAISW